LTLIDVRKAFSCVHFLALYLLLNTITKTAFLRALLGLVSSSTKQTSAWLNCKIRRICTLRHCLLLLPMN